MTVFEVYVNGKPVCRAGLENFGVMSAVLNRVKRNPKNHPKLTDPTAFEEELGFSVGGLILDGAGDEHVDYTLPAIQHGDEITIKVVDSDKFDPPTKVRRVNKAAIREEKRRYLD